MKLVFLSIHFVVLFGVQLSAQIGSPVLLEKFMHPSTVKMADLDLDGDLDLLSAGTDYYLWNGLVVSLTEGGENAQTDIYDFILDDLIVGDINGDNYPDLAIRYQPLTSFNMYYAFMINNGDGTFAEPIELAEFDGSGGPQFLALGDINGDPYPDLFVNKLSSPQNFYFQGTPGGFMSNQVSLGTPRIQSLVDLNDDGVLDKIYVSGNTDTNIQSGELLKFAINDGNGNFIDSPVELSPQIVGATGFWNLKAYDMDGDEMPEILIGSSNRVVLKSTLGNLNFTAMSVYAENTETEHLTGFDVNGNGTPDRLRPTTLVGHSIASSVIYKEVGFAIFDDIFSAQPLAVDTIYLPGNTGFIHQEILPQIKAIGDINSDGNPDLVIGNHGLGIKLGEGIGNFGPENFFINAVELSTHGERKLVQLDGNALADWMSFGEANLFQATFNTDGFVGQSVVPIFDSLPVFEENLIIQYAFVDVVGSTNKEFLLFSSPDGVDLDLWLYNQIAPATFELIGHQAAVVTGVNQYLSGIYNRFEIREADIDNDGDQDVSIFQKPTINNGVGNMFVLRNTDGQFTTNQVLSPFGFENYTGGPQWIDLSGDGFPELITSTFSNSGLFIHPNVDGMIVTNDIPSANLVSSVYPVSLNDDNLMDLIVHSYNTPIRKWTNQGDFEFGVTDLGANTPSMNGLVDINNDGALDILSNGSTWVNQGNGTFQSVAIDMIPSSSLTFDQAKPFYGDYNFLPDLFFSTLHQFTYYPNISEDLTPGLDACPGDFNDDGITNVQDLLEFIVAVPCYGNCYTDLNQDFIADVQDLLLFLEAYGLSCQ